MKQEKLEEYYNPEGEIIQEHQFVWTYIRIVLLILLIASVLLLLLLEVTGSDVIITLT